jgi:DNA-binding transcriptional LysR family regulator
MNLRHLEILRALIRHRTTVAAAAELGLSQPAVSNALRSMEVQAGFPLFQRINNRLFATSEAISLYEESKAIFALHARLETRVRDLKENRAGHLSIVATPPLAYSVIPPALKRFNAMRPRTSTFFDVRRYEGVIDGLLNRVAELGFAIGLSHHPEIDYEIVYEGRMVCAFSPDHPLSSRSVVSAAELVDYPLIGLERGTMMGEQVRRSFDSEGVPFKAAVEVRYCNTACVLASAGVGVAVVDGFSPKQVATNLLAIRPFIPETPVTAYIMWSKTQPLSRLAKAFANEVRFATVARSV